MPQKLALIVFPDEWINYSPSMLNSISVLNEQNYKVELLSFGRSAFNVSAINATHTQINIPFWCYKLLGKLKLYETLKYWILCTLLFVKRNNKYTTVIGVDNIGYAGARRFFKHALFFSLEIKKDVFFDKCLALGINYCIIQSAERYNFLFDDFTHKPIPLYVQNAPTLPLNFKVTAHEINSRTKQLIYWGNIANFYGIEPLIDALLLLPSEYTLTLRGIKNESYDTILRTKYQQLITINRLFINYNYVSQDELLNEMKKYYIGFVMFDFTKIKTTDYNCISSPSGKQFNYMAAGVPTIGQNIVGFAPIAQNSAGILLNEFNTTTIINAISTAETNYTSLAHNALQAANQYDFKTCFNRALNTFSLK